MNPNYRDMLSVFAEEGVEYLLVDAYAMAQYTLSTPPSGWPTSTR